MGSFTTTYDKIIRQPALTMPGNFTGSEAACTAGNASSIRTLLSLATTSDVTFDIIRATTSVQTPLVNNASAALTLGNSTYGVTVPGTLTMSSSSAGYIKSSTGEIIAGFDLGGFYFGGGLAADNRHITIGNLGASVTTRVLNKALLVKTTTDDGVNALQVLGTAKLRNTAGNGQLEIAASGSSSYTAGVRLTEHYGGYWDIQNVGGGGSPAYALGFKYGGNQVASITAAGAATFSGGITGYTTSPYLLLESTTNGPPYVKLKNTAAERRWVMDSSGGVGFENTAVGTNYAYFKSNGFYGLGNFYAGLEPTARFQVDGGIAIGYAPGTSPTVPTNGIVAAGDISMQKATQGYIYAYNTAGTSYIRISNSGTSYLNSTGNLNLESNSGAVEVFKSGLDSNLFISNSTGATYMTIGSSTLSSNSSSLTFTNPIIQLSATTTTRCYKSGTNSTFQVYDSSVSKYLQSTHDGTNGIVSTSSGALVLSPVTNTTFSTDAYHTGVLYVHKTSGASVVQIGSSVGASHYLQVSGTNGGYVQSNVTSALGSSGTYLGLYGHTNTMVMSGTGHILLNPANSLIPIMGVTSSYPAIKRSSTTAAFRLGDDSADAPISCAGITASGGATITGGGVSNTGGLKIGSLQAGVGGIWEASVTPSTTNYAFITNTSSTIFNASSTLYFRVGGVTDVATVSTASGLVSTILKSTNYAIFNYGGSPVLWSAALANAGATEYRTLLNRGNVGTFVTASGGIYGWCSTTNLTGGAETNDTGVARDSAGVVEINNGTLVSGGGSYGSLKCAGQQNGYVAKVADYTLTSSDCIVEVTANSVTITLETAVGCAGRVHEIINTGAGTVTINTTSAQTISGSASGSLTLAQWKSMTVKSNGANWLIVAQIA